MIVTLMLSSQILIIVVAVKRGVPVALVMRKSREGGITNTGRKVDIAGKKGRKEMRSGRKSGRKSERKSEKKSEKRKKVMVMVHTYISLH